MNKQAANRDSRPEVGLRVCDCADPDALRPAIDWTLHGGYYLDPRTPEQSPSFEDNWLFARLAKKYRPLIAPSPDVILCDGLGSNLATVRSVFLQFRRRFGFRPCLGMMSIENMRIDPSLADFSISLRTSSDDNFYLPLFHLSCLDEYEQWRSGQFVGESARNRAALKTRFCLFLQTRHSFVREEFCRRLARYKRVDCPGRALNNVAVPGFGPLRHEAALDANPGALRAQYKFAIAFENNSADYYLTEKIRMALMAGSIPIYWGCPQVAEYINPACFVNCHDYPDFDAVVERVKQIDQDPALYEQYRSAPILLPDSKLHDSSPARLAAFMEGIIEKALARRQNRGATWTPAERLHYARVAAERLLFERAPRRLQRMLLPRRHRLAVSRWRANRRAKFETRPG